MASTTPPPSSQNGQNVDAESDDSADLPPPVYEVEEEPVERRMDLDGKYVEVIDGKEVVIERRQRGDA